MDYTSLYYTIAGCAATLIGIIGGLVTAHVLYINNKIAENKSWLEKLEEEQKKNKNRLREIENDIDLKYILDYIQNPDVVIDLINNEYPVLTPAKEADYFYIEETKLKEVRLKATEIFENISNIYLNGRNAVEINKDDIPIDIVDKYDNNSLDYFICKLICSKIDMFHLQPLENGKNISYLNEFEFNKKKKREKK